MLQQFWMDVRYALRALRGARLVAIATVVTLGIGIGLLTAIFSVVNAAMLRPLPYSGAERLVALSESSPRGSSVFSAMSPAAIATIRERSRSFASIGAYTPRSRNVVLATTTRTFSVAEVSAELFATLRVSPVRGRTFTPDEANADATIVLISHELWTTQFSTNESVVGSAIRLDGIPFTVIGVMPPGFNFPSRQQLWVPLIRRAGAADWMDPSVSVAARLVDGVTPAAATAELATIARSFAREQPSLSDGWSIRLRPEVLERRAILGPLTWMIVAAGMFLLLIACANIATVLLARAASRRGEMAVRAALGASRRRLVGQHLTETLLLALAGGVASLFIATWVLDLAWALLPMQNMPTWLVFSIDWRVLTFTLGTSLVALLAVGVGPALTATRVRLSDSLKVGSASDTASRRELRASRALVVVEVAAAFVLFTGSVLMVRSFRMLRDFDFGIRAAQVLSVQPWLGTDTYSAPARREQYFAMAVDNVRRVPSVSAAAVRADLDSLRGAPWASDSAGGWLVKYSLVSVGTDQASTTTIRTPEASRYVVTPAYFRVVGLPVSRGRAFDDRDQEHSTRVAVVSQGVADRLWPNADPVGRNLHFGGSAELLTVIGVVPNVRLMRGGGTGVSARWENAIYLVATQATSRFRSELVLIRTADDPLVTAPTVRRVMAAIDPYQSISRVERLSDSLSSGASLILSLGVLFASIAAGALVLASIGLYGVIAYSVTRRTREIGVRMALGADSVALRRAVTGQALRLTAIGLLAGTAGSLVLVRLMRSFLYGVASYDPITYAIVSAVFLGLGAIASAIPAHRATRVDPLVALRAD